MTKQISAFEIAQICRGTVINGGTQTASGLCIDSRTIVPGNAYAAIIGEVHDGHTFIESAIKNGASVIIASKPVDSAILGSAAAVMVDDTLIALQELAAQHRSTLKTKIIGVTGSNGKTTTRSMLWHLLSQEHVCASTRGNLNNHIGVPLTLLSLDSSADYAVIEMGMNHQGEIKRLCEIARPDAALICNVGSAHVGMLGSLENIASAKAEILENLEPGQIAVAPGDSEFIELLRQKCPAKIITFGEKADNDFKISNASVKLEQISFDISNANQAARCVLPLAGKHNALNAAAALAMYASLGFSLKEGCERLKSFKSVSARLEKISVENNITVLLDCYNANAASMKEALSYLSLCQGDKIAVLGDMKELGSMSKMLHRQIGSYAAGCSLNLLMCVGKEAKEIAKAAIEDGLPDSSVIALNSDTETADLLRNRLTNGSTVLFKASRGMHFEKIVRRLWPTLAKELH